MKGKKVQQKTKVIKFDAINGESADGIMWELGYNKVSKRYDLRRGSLLGDTVYSHISLDAVKNKATDKEVVWREVA